MRHIIKEMEFSDGPFAITGDALFDLDLQEMFDADIGGRDGLEVTSCELVHVNVGGLVLIRYMMGEFLTEAHLAHIEATVAEEVQEQIDAGDFAEVA